MADNYLEKKMEDIRLGKTASTAPHRRQAPGAGRICFDFSPRRVLVTGGCNGIGETITDTYLRAGCKVAVFDTDSDKGFATARDKGIRFYPVDISDSEALTTAFANLLKAWRDIDIIVSNNTPDTALLLAQEWARHKRRYPIPSDYGGRLISILPVAHASDPETAPGSVQRALLAAEDLSRFGITSNILRLDSLSENPATESPYTKNAAISRIISKILLLSLPVSAFINGADIPAISGIGQSQPVE